MKCVFCSRQDRAGSICNPNCMLVEKYMYDKAWYEGKAGEQVKDELSKRHGIPLWRVEEIIEVWEARKRGE